MPSKTYYRAQKFLRLRSKGEDPFTAIDDLTYNDREEVVDFLKTNHQIKFL